LVALRRRKDNYDPADTTPAAGGAAYKPSSFGIGANPGHHEHCGPSTNVPTEASG
jgi:hypothetical protein